tara:strand:- start:246 stop:602 length:357 start_codon:yes stop_codon:yes gene_type:complete
MVDVIKRHAILKAKHTDLKNDLRHVQRDYGQWLRKNTNTTGPEMKTGTDFYERTKEAAAKKLDTFEKKYKFGTYAKGYYSKADRKAKALGGGRAAAAIDSRRGGLAKSLMTRKLTPKT